MKRLDALLKKYPNLIALAVALAVGLIVYFAFKDYPLVVAALAGAACGYPLTQFRKPMIPPPVALAVLALLTIASPARAQASFYVADQCSECATALPWHVQQAPARDFIVVYTNRQGLEEPVFFMNERDAIKFLNDEEIVDGDLVGLFSISQVPLRARLEMIDPDCSPNDGPYESTVWRRAEE